MLHDLIWNLLDIALTLGVLKDVSILGSNRHDNSSLTVYLRPINRFVAKRVFSGLTTACLLAATPTRRSPSLENATVEGVVLEPEQSVRVKKDEFCRRIKLPSLFSMILGVLPSIIAVAEFVVPRSIPITCPFTFSSVLLNRENDDEIVGRRAAGLVLGKAGVARGNCIKQSVRASNEKTYSKEEWSTYSPIKFGG